MKIVEIISEINAPNGKAETVAKKLGVSRDTLRRRLKSVGYEYSQTTKEYGFTGEGSKENVDNLLFSELGSSSPSPRKKEKSNEEVREKSDTNHKEQGLELDKNEIEFIKKLYSKMNKSENKYSLGFDYMDLPDPEPAKKHSIEISQDTFDRFDKFSKTGDMKKFSKNKLIEMALIRFMEQH